MKHVLSWLIAIRFITGCSGGERFEVAQDVTNGLGIKTLDSKDASTDGAILRNGQDSGAIILDSATVQPATPRLFTCADLAPFCHAAPADSDCLYEVNTRVDANCDAYIKLHCIQPIIYATPTIACDAGPQ